MIRLPDFDDCILGLATTFDGNSCLAYSEEKILKKLQKVSDMDPEEAMEHFLFNIRGGYFGEGNPVFVLKLEPYELEELFDNYESEEG